jgi:hypothetical protein
VSSAKSLASLAKRVLPHAHFATKAAFSTNRLASRVWPAAPPVGMVSLAPLVKPTLLWAILSVSNAQQDIESQETDASRFNVDLVAFNVMMDQVPAQLAKLECSLTAKVVYVRSETSFLTNRKVDASNALKAAPLAQINRPALAA